MLIKEEKKYHRSEIAKQQLRTAVDLFINGKNLSSVITLSAAASNILYQLVLNANQEPFIDYARRVHEAFTGWIPKRKGYKNHIDNIFGVNVHKHMGKKCAKKCSLDLYNSAKDMLLVAMSDYIKLYGQHHDFVVAYLKWRWQRENGANIARYIEHMPDKFRELEKWPKKIAPETISKESSIKEKNQFVKFITVFSWPLSN